MSQFSLERANAPTECRLCDVQLIRRLREGTALSDRNQVPELNEGHSYVLFSHALKLWEIVQQCIGRVDLPLIDWVEIVNRSIYEYAGGC
jgi:hypothetical protein